MASMRTAAAEKSPRPKPANGQVTPFPQAETIKTVGVIGAGQMGNGIAHVSALAGLNVRLLDVSEERIKAGLDAIKKNLSRQAERGKISADDVAQALKRIKTGVDYKLFGDCDMVIEAATENEQIKREILKTLLP